MKKLYDWNINLTISVQNNHRSLNVICSVHTNIHQLKLKILKQLGMRIFDTEIDLYGGNSKWKPLSPTSSLQQNGIQQNCSLKAIIHRVKENKSLDIEVQDAYDKKNKTKPKSQGYGLFLWASCSNEKCVDFNQDVLISFGFGNFPFYSLISNLKCEKCPYKNQYLRPNMICKSAKLSQCLVKISGTFIDHHLIPNQRQTNYNKVKEEKDIPKIIEKSGIKWEKDLILHIKQL